MVAALEELTWVSRFLINTILLMVYMICFYLLKNITWLGLDFYSTCSFILPLNEGHQHSISILRAHGWHKIMFHACTRCVIALTLPPNGHWHSILVLRAHDWNYHMFYVWYEMCFFMLLLLFGFRLEKHISSMSTILWLFMFWCMCLHTLVWHSVMQHGHGPGFLFGYVALVVLFYLVIWTNFILV